MIIKKINQISLFIIIIIISLLCICCGDDASNINNKINNQDLNNNNNLDPLNNIGNNQTINNENNITSTNNVSNIEPANNENNNENTNIDNSSETSNNINNSSSQNNSLNNQVENNSNNSNSEAVNNSNNIQNNSNNIQNNSSNIQNNSNNIQNNSNNIQNNSNNIQNNSNNIQNNSSNIQNNSNNSVNYSGEFPGDITRNILVNEQQIKYYLYVPENYSHNTPVPALLTFHGQAGNPENADLAAQYIRNDWAQVSENNTFNQSFIVITQIAGGSSGSWLLPGDINILSEIINDVLAAYNINSSRIYGWGFSAGGHLMHQLGLLNADFFAAYSVSSGVFQDQSILSESLRKIPVDIHIGSTDPNRQYCDINKQWMIQSGWIEEQNLFYREFEGGHTYNGSHLLEIWSNISIFTLQQ